MESHWTERSVDDFVHRMSFDFITQLAKRLESSPLSRAELARKLGVSKGRISQILNNPGNLTLKRAVAYARAVGMKVSVVAYDDGDPDNQNGPISSEIFGICWENQNRPRDFDTASSATLSDTALTSETECIPARKGFYIVRKNFAATKQISAATTRIGQGLTFKGSFGEQEVASTQFKKRAAGGRNG
ncbi:MAG: helix-turn-helix transcriptional regulator [Pyrinomonadaceae bacterium]|nr:helix-turn-helix transcriptional regulator [Pyrinomonadaceae bacterium]